MSSLGLYDLSYDRHQNKVCIPFRLKCGFVLFAYGNKWKHKCIIYFGAYCMYVHMCNGTIYSSPCVCVYSLSKKKISDFLSVLSGFEVGMGIVDVFAEHSKRFK